MAAMVLNQWLALLLQTMDSAQSLVVVVDAAILVLVAMASSAVVDVVAEAITVAAVMEKTEVEDEEASVADAAKAAVVGVDLEVEHQLLL